MKPFNKGQKNDYDDAGAIAEAVLQPNLQTASEKSQGQFDLQALHRVRSRLVSRRTATINQIRAFLNEQGTTVRKGRRAPTNSFETILEGRKDEKSPRIWAILIGLCGVGCVKGRGCHRRLSRSDPQEFAIDRIHGTEKLRPQNLTAQMVNNDLSASEITVQA